MSALSDAEARELRRKLVLRVLGHAKALGESPAFGFISFGNLMGIEQVADGQEPSMLRQMVAGVVFSGMNLEPDEVILVTKYKLPL